MESIAEILARELSQKKEYIENLISLSSPSVLKALKSYYNFCT